MRLDAIKNSPSPNGGAKHKSPIRT